MDKQTAVNEMRASLLKARTEAGSLAQEVSWVVCWGDLTPFRVNDLGEIKTAGGKIFTSTQRHARRIAKALDAQVKANDVINHSNVCAMPASGWAVKRICWINEMLATLEKNA